jgi:hypothetical protein
MTSPCAVALMVLTTRTPFAGAHSWIVMRVATAANSVATSWDTITLFLTIINEIRNNQTEHLDSIKL